MIRVDLHMHTRYSHGRDDPQAMYAAAQAAGLELMGFSEHSPRPCGYDYTREYREQLRESLPRYVSEVAALKEKAAREGGCQVLFGMEMDWLDGAEAFVREACAACPFDYLIGSVHFLGNWGYDDVLETWDSFSQGECEQHYRDYFAAWRRMIASGLFNIAAHPDLIKIASVDRFHRWLNTSAAEELVGTALRELRDAGMAMEVSSAGLRKPCREIYPAPLFMRLARELNVPIAFASDAHTTDDVAYGFPRLLTYARAFGFTESVSVCKGQLRRHPFGL